jgi:hypothetical protein
MSTDPNKYNRALISDALEHDDTAGPKVKRVGNYIYDTNTLEWKKWDGTANIDMATEGIATEATLAKTTTIYKQIEMANDNITTINYTSAAKTDVSTIVQSSATVGYTATETFNNTGATTLVITRGVA